MGANFHTSLSGLVEYFNWCEDLKIAPVLAVYAGLSLEEDVITGTDLKPYIDDVMDELEVRFYPLFFRVALQTLSNLKGAFN